MNRTSHIPLSDLNSHLTCLLCGGYYIDAVTIIECLHSFCRTCLVKYLDTSYFCPVCDVMIHKTKPLCNIRSDKTLQNLVYKLVPGLYKDEMKRRRDYYQTSTTHKADRVQAVRSEDRGHETPERELGDENALISLSLQLDSSKMPIAPANTTQTDHPIRYLQCPAAVTIAHLTKFIRLKYDLPSIFHIDVYHSEDSLNKHYTLLDIAYLYAWKRRKPLSLHYTICEKSPTRHNSASSRSSSLASSDTIISNDDLNLAITAQKSLSDKKQNYDGKKIKENIDSSNVKINSTNVKIDSTNVKIISTNVKIDSTNVNINSNESKIVKTGTRGRKPKPKVDNGNKVVRKVGRPPKVKTDEIKQNGVKRKIDTPSKKGPEPKKAFSPQVVRNKGKRLSRSQSLKLLKSKDTPVKSKVTPMKRKLPPRDTQAKNKVQRQTPVKAGGGNTAQDKKTNASTPQDKKQAAKKCGIDNGSQKGKVEDDKIGNGKGKNNDKIKVDKNDTKNAVNHKLNVKVDNDVKNKGDSKKDAANDVVDKPSLSNREVDLKGHKNAADIPDNQQSSSEISKTSLYVSANIGDRSKMSVPIANDKNGAIKTYGSKQKNQNGSSMSNNKCSANVIPLKIPTVSSASSKSSPNIIPVKISTVSSASSKASADAIPVKSNISSAFNNKFSPNQTTVKTSVITSKSNESLLKTSTITSPSVTYIAVKPTVHSTIKSPVPVNSKPINGSTTSIAVNFKPQPITSKTSTMSYSNTSDSVVSSTVSTPERGSKSVKPAVVSLSKEQQTDFDSDSDNDLVMDLAE